MTFALRWMRRSPWLTVAAVSSLAAGIGLNTALFSIIDALLLRPAEVRSGDELVNVYTSSSDGDTYATASWPDLQDLRRENSTLVDLAGYSAMYAALKGDTRSRLVLGEVVTGNYFDVLGVPAAVGRTLTPTDDQPTAARVVVVSDRFWRRELGGTPDALGRTLRIKGQLFTVVGVLPARFSGMLPMLAPELWVPTAWSEDVEPAGIQDVVPSPTGQTRIERRGQRWLFLKGRLRPGITAAAARADLDVIMARLVAAHPETNKGRRLALLPAAGVRLHPDADRALVPLGAGLMVAVGLVLLVACANVASMLLASASARRREIGIRLALGADRARLVRQFLIESGLLAGLGAAGGMLLAIWLTRLAASPDLPIPVPVSMDLRIDGRVLAFTTLLSLVAGLLAGLAPALRATKPDIVQDLRGDAPVGQALGRRWTLRDGLVMGQIAVTMVLLVASGLLVRSLALAQRTGLGFEKRGIAILSTDVDLVGYAPERARQFFEDARQAMLALPGVTEVALTERAPFSLNFNAQQFYVPGVHAPGAQLPSLQVTRVSNEYFRMLGVPILQGRGFTTADTPQSPGVVVINEAMARKYWPGESAVGQRIHLRGPEGPGFEVVGMVADHKVSSVREGATPYVHFALGQRPSAYAAFMARTSGEAAQVLAQMQRLLLAREPNLVFVENQTMEQQVSATLLPVQVATWVIGVVGGLALLLAAMGLYGVVAYSVARRTREMGIRFAIGATRGAVMGLVLRQGLVLAAVGTFAGAALAFVAAQALQQLLFGVSPADPVAWGVAILVVLLSATLANLVPARRAATVSALVAMKME